MTLTLSPRHFVHALFASFLSVYIAFLPLLSPPDFSAWKRSKTFVTAGFGVDAAGNPVGDFKGIGNEILGGINMDALGSSGVFGNSYLSEQWLVQTAVNTGVKSAASSALYGTDFIDNFASGMMSSAVDQVVGAAIDGASDVFGHSEFSVEKMLIKATANCLGAEAKGQNCASAALGTVGAEIYLSQFTPEELAAMDRRDIQRGAERVAIILGAFTSGGDIANLNTTVAATALDIDNNYLNHDQVVQFMEDVQDDCTVNGMVDDACVANLYEEKYAAFSEKNRDDMLACDTQACWDTHLAELYAGVGALDNTAYQDLLEADSAIGTSSIFDTVASTNNYSLSLANQPGRQGFSIWCADKNTQACQGGYEAWAEKAIDDATAGIISDNLPDLGEVSLFVNADGEIVAIPNVLDVVQVAKELGLETVSDASEYVKWSGRILGPTGEVFVELTDDDGWTWRDTVTVPVGLVTGAVTGSVSAALCGGEGPLAVGCGFVGGNVGYEVGSAGAGVIYDYITYDWDALYEEFQ